MTDKPQQGAVDSTVEFRINATAWKVNEAFEKARIEARDECLWLSKVCRMLLEDNNRLRIENERNKKKITEFERLKEKS